MKQTHPHDEIISCRLPIWRLRFSRKLRQASAHEKTRKKASPRGFHCCHPCRRRKVSHCRTGRNRNLAHCEFHFLEHRRNETLGRRKKLRLHLHALRQPHAHHRRDQTRRARRRRS